MVTEIGIVSGKVLEFLEKNRLLVFGEAHASLQEPRDLVLMSLGWLLKEGRVHIMEDPSRSPYKNLNRMGPDSEASMFDLVILHDPQDVSPERIKNIPVHISSVAEKILMLLRVCGNVLSLDTVQCAINEHRDIILMALGWLIRTGHVRKVAGIYLEICRDGKEKALCLSNI